MNYTVPTEADLSLNNLEIGSNINFTEGFAFFLSTFTLAPGPLVYQIQNVSFNKTVNKKIKEICGGKRDQVFSFFNTYVFKNF